MGAPTLVSPPRRLGRRGGETDERSAAAVVQKPCFHRGKPGGELFARFTPTCGKAEPHTRFPSVVCLSTQKRHHYQKRYWIAHLVTMVLKWRAGQRYP